MAARKQLKTKKRKELKGKTPKKAASRIKVKKTVKPARVLNRKRAKKARKALAPPRPKKQKPLSKDLFDGVGRTKIMVVGIGGGGGSIVSEIASRIKKASFVVANTDLQALKKTVRGVRLFQFGQTLTHGLGTGMSSETGKIAAQQEKEKIKKLLEGQDLCILIACLGGGAGSGAAPVFAKISKDLGNLTYGIFTLPFEFEGEKKAHLAKESLGKIRPNVNAFSVIPNERIFQTIDKETPLRQALSVINKNLGNSLEGLIEMVYDPGLINIDFADLRTIFEGKGRLTYLNAVEVLGPDRGEEAIKNLANSLYPYTLKGAKGILFNIAGEKTLALDEISQISKTISNLAHKEAKIIFGISQTRPSFAKQNLGGQDKKYQDKIKLTILAVGCSSGIFSDKAKEPKLEKKTEKKPVSPGRKRKKPQQGKSKEKPKSMKKPKSKKAKKGNKPKQTNKISSGQSQSQAKAETEEQVSLAVSEEKPEIKIRRNGLQIKKEIKEIEQELLNREKEWETPAFLRRHLGENK